MHTSRPITNVLRLYLGLVHAPIRSLTPYCPFRVGAIGFYASEFIRKENPKEVCHLLPLPLTLHLTLTLTRRGDRAHLHPAGLLSSS